ARFLAAPLAGPFTAAEKFKKRPWSGGSDKALQKCVPLSSGGGRDGAGAVSRLEARCFIGPAGRPRGRFDFSQRIVGAPRFSFEVSALLDGQTLMENIALNMGLRLQLDAKAPPLAHHPAAHHDVLGRDAADYLRFVSEQERAAMDIALDLAVDLNLALGSDITGDRQVLADDRGDHLACARAWALGRIGCGPLGEGSL